MQFGSRASASAKYAMHLFCAQNSSLFEAEVAAPALPRQSALVAASVSISLIKVTFSIEQVGTVSGVSTDLEFDSTPALESKLEVDAEPEAETDASSHHVTSLLIVSPRLVPSYSQSGASGCS